jgi:zinc and cadmium transporter
MATWTWIALALIVNGLAGLAGGLLSDRRLKQHQPALVGFAAGALVAAVFLDIVPEAYAVLGRASLSWAFGSFVAMALLEWGVGHHHAGDHRDVSATLPTSLLGSDALHNIGDGAAIAAAFLSSPKAGVLVAFAVMVHEVPQEVGDYALLRASGYSRRRALFALFVVQLTAVAGAVAVGLGAKAFDQLSSVMLAVAAGTFLYIGATDLLPEIHAARTPETRRARMLGFLAGAGVLALATALPFHG